MTIWNADTVNRTFTVRYFDNGTTRILVKALLTPGQTLLFQRDIGWSVPQLSPTGVSAATVVIADAGGDTTTWPVLAGSQTGNQTLETDSGLTYNATTHTLSATTFAGALAGNAATVTTNANLTGDVTSSGNATTLTNAAVIAKVLTGYTSGAGTVAATDSILAAIQKLNGNTPTAGTLTGTTLNATVVTSSLTSVGTLGSLVVTGNLTNSAMTAGSVLFAGTAGLISQYNAGLFWDATNHKLGISTTSPQRTLDLSSTGQLTFGDISVTTDSSTSGIYWNSGSSYAIARTSGTWSAPDYQQLSIQWQTGIIIDGGVATGGKSGLTLQPNGGNIGIGATNLGQALTLDRATQNAIGFYESGTLRGLFGIAGSANQIFTGTADNDMAMRSESNLYLGANGNNISLSLYASGSIVVGNAALATSVVDGFLYIPSCAGTPTGVPTSYSGRVPMVFDSTNDILYIYRGAWKKATASLITGAVTWQ